MHVLIHGDVARPRGGRAVIERYRDARPAQVIRRPAAEREDIPRSHTLN